MSDAPTSDAPLSRTTISRLKKREAPAQISPSQNAHGDDSLPRLASVGQGVHETTTLLPGILVGRAMFRPSHKQRVTPQPIAEIEIEGLAPSLLIYTAAAGQAAIRDASTGKDYWLSERDDIIQYTDKTRCTLLADAAQNADIRIISISGAALGFLLGEHEALIFSAKREDGDGMASGSIWTYSPPEHISQALYSTFPSAPTGSARNLFAQAKTLEYLSLLADHMEALKAGSSESTRFALARRVRDEVLSINGKLPSLKELANNFGISAKTLNEAFKQEFGQTIGAFATEQRLCEARETLMHSDVPMKVLAVRLGYSHVNNFIAAFTKKFGCAPGSLRRNRKSDHIGSASYSGNGAPDCRKYCEYSGGRRCKVAGLAPCCIERSRQADRTRGAHASNNSSVEK